MVKLNARDAKRFFGHPEPAVGAVLIYGPDPMRVAHCCRKTIDALVGDTGREEMRADTVDISSLSGNAGALAAKLKTQSFFPGMRTLQMEGANDSVTGAISDALEQRGPNDAFLVVTAGSLRPASRLRKLFEGHGTALCAPVYADPATDEEIREFVTKAGIGEIDSGAAADLAALGRDVSPLELEKVIEKLALYKAGDQSPVSSFDVQECAPANSEVLVDRLLEYVADRKPARVSPAFRLVSGRGQTPVSVCIQATRLFRRIHQVACHPEGPHVGVTRLRPPAFGPRRGRMIEHARMWGEKGAEAAIRELLETDRALRLGRKYPARAFVERALIRVALMKPG